MMNHATVIPAEAGGPITVLCADDHPMVREGVAAMLCEEADMLLVASAATGREAVAAYRRWLPDITLMDLRMPDMDGIDAIREICSVFPKAKIIALTSYEGDIHALRAMDAGAVCHVIKNTLRKDLVAIVRATHHGTQTMPARMAHALATYSMKYALSKREMQVLAAAATGKTNRTIGVELCIAEDTVKTHMKNILAKLGAHDRTHAVMLAFERGYLEI